MKRVRLSVFPWTQDAETLLKNIDLLDCDITAAASYKEDRLGDDPPGGLRVADDPDDLLRESEGLLIPPDADTERLLRAPRYLNRARALKKKIWLSAQCAQTLELPDDDVHILARSAGTVEMEKDWNRLHRFPVPILAVMGAGERCDKFAMQLALKRYFDPSDYKVAYLCSNPLGALFGMTTLPDCLWENALTFAEKVVLLNRYLWKLYRAEKPDLLVVGVPGGVFRLPDDECDRFCEMAHVFTYAAEIDAAVLNVYFGTALSDPRTADDLKRYVSGRYGVPVCLFGVSGNVMRKSDVTKSYEYYPVEPYVDAEMEKACQNAAVPVVHIDDPARLNGYLDQLLDDMENGVHAL